ncbi:P1 family peptidase [Zavarzinia sp. CC-PAN008]|uniref:P1 family peptidase n=1 Tax=Zavarzinia sp. CC-PAN008 TaxID=3243332 RepID=UPI003F74866C
MPPDAPRPDGPRPGPRNLITDVDGIRIGNAADAAIRTGVSVILPEQPAVAAVDVRGGAPGTRETDALDATCLVEGIHAIVLSGGSVFGLGAADGVVQALSNRGIGLAMGAKAIPVVPGAILFDLNNGGDKAWTVSPYPSLGVQALEQALGPQGAGDFPLGTHGAGTGARTGQLQGGLGSASLVQGPLQVGALVAANAVGAATLAGQPQFWSWALEQDGEFGGLPPPAHHPRAEEALPGRLAPPAVGGNTTLAVIATNARLDRAQALRIAIMAQDGLARAVRPAHTPYDGDTVFVLSTGRVPLDTPTALALTRIGHMAADCLARAFARGIYHATGFGDWPTWSATWRDRSDP